MGAVRWCTACIPGLNVTSTVSHLHELQTADSTSTGYIVLASLVILVGIVICFYGYSIFRAALCTIGFGAGGAFSFFIVCGAVGSLWGAVIALGIGGLLCGAVVLKIERLGLILCGAGGGLMLALYFNGYLLHSLYSAIPGANHDYAPYLTDLGFAVLGALFTLWIERELIIGSTALTGAYFFCWGALRLLSQANAIDRTLNFSPLDLFTGRGCTGLQCYMAITGCLLLALMGAVVQWRRTSKFVNRFSRHHERMKLVDEHGNVAYVLVE